MASSEPGTVCGQRERTEAVEPHAGRAKRARGEQLMASDKLHDPEDPVSSALKKIAAHIGKPHKFVKASCLLRHLLDNNVVDKAHRDDFVCAIAAAFVDKARICDPLLRKEYKKLVQSYQQHMEALSKLQRAQLQVYAILGGLQNELFTDDSFVFNKVINRIKEHISQLPEASAEGHMPSSQEHCMTGLTTALQDPVAVDESDPFGLNGLLLQTAKKPQHCQTSSAARLLSERREAVLQCVLTAKSLHKIAWAKTSIELLIEHLHEERRRFAGANLDVIAELHLFVKSQRAARKLGGGKDDRTEFERARDVWSQATVSHRGKIGGAGDHKTEAWLG